MIITGQWHKRVPKDPAKNMRFRQMLLRKCRDDHAFRAQVWKVCSEDPIFFCNAFIYQYNPGMIGEEVGPFITWDFQDRAIVGGDEVVDGETVHRWGVLECVRDQKDARWPKSREMGATYIVLICMLWLCLFQKNKTALVLSRDKDAVNEPGNLGGSLFPKIKFMLDRLPLWMTGSVTDRPMGYEFKKTSCAIFGEASTQKAGVSGRFTMALIDEFGQIDEDREIYGRTADSCQSRIFVFTHKNTSSMAYDLCYDPQFATQREILTHWSQHPTKRRGLYRYDSKTNKTETLDRFYVYPANWEFVQSGKPLGGPFAGLRSPWYDEQCIRRPERDISMDLDIDPKGATTEFFPSFVIATLKRTVCREPLWRGSLDYDASTGKPIEMKVDSRGPLKVWLNPKSNKLIANIRAGAGADLSAGVGKSPSALSIMNYLTGEKVAEYLVNDLDPKQCAVLFSAILFLFEDEFEQPPKLSWETNGPGVTFGSTIMYDLNYPNCWSTDEDPANRLKRAAKKWGWHSNEENKRKLLEEYSDALRTKRCLNYSEEALDETLRFVYSAKGVEYKRKGKKDASELDAEAHHGDIVIADAQAWMVVRRGYFSNRIVKAEEIDQRTMLWRQNQREQDSELVWL